MLLLDAMQTVQVRTALADSLVATVYPLTAGVAAQHLLAFNLVHEPRGAGQKLQDRLH